MGLLKRIGTSCFVLLSLGGFAQTSSGVPAKQSEGSASTVPAKRSERSALPDSAKHLAPVTIAATRGDHFSSGNKTQSIDSTTLAQYKNGNLADLLENESPLFIKSYGLGSLAVSSFRGGSAQHTALLWNGFNLNSPMYGQFDFALVPNSFIGKAAIQFGGSSALWGSGAVGGAILLSGNPVFDKGISASIGSSFGSFSAYQQNATVQISKARWIASLKVFTTTAKNDFPFHNTQLPGAPLMHQSNAALKEHGLLSENYFSINARQQINFCFWYQDNDRNIPPTMLQRINRTNQKDKSYRFSSEWRRTGEQITLMARAAYFDESLLFSDYAQLDYTELSRSKTFISEVEAKIRAGEQHLFDVGLNNTFAQAASEGYQGIPRQDRLALFAAYRFTSKNQKLNATLSVRQEIIKNKFVPFTFSAGADYQLFKWLLLKGSVAKVYRVPTFNDLYWFPGGNPDLLPESGYCEEGTLELKGTLAKKAGWMLQGTLFNRNMQNWILWLPSQYYWSPQNIMNVWSRGAETNLAFKLPYRQFVFGLNVLTNYVISTNEQVKTENDASLHKQLIYVPMYSGHAKLSLSWKKFSLAYTENYTGYRYTATDNSEYLKPYLLANVHAGFKTNFKKLSLDVFAQVNNVFATPYEVLLNRAMPLRNYQAGITIQFNAPSKNKN